MNKPKLTLRSDLSDEEWELILPHLADDSPIGRPRQYGWRVVFNGIFYVLKTGCQWRYVPTDIAPWQVIYRGFRKLGGLEWWQSVNEWLSVEVRLEEGRQAQPSAGVLDAQTIKSAPTGAHHGYDAGKKTKGSKRHIVVDTLGLLIGVAVHDASVVDCRGAKLAFDKAAKSSQAQQLEHLWADGGYDRICAYEAANDHDWRLEVLERPAGSKSFVVVKKRWVVERTFAWLVQNRRLARDYERQACNSEQFIYAAMVRLMLKRLTKN